ncbi:ATP-binding protein [Chitinophaga sp. sic0106]|uniref:ATP-binding protein n=1 Tax=Chitinophaga sp. sic0106 TaxID=2854785 RepID=UPI001C45A421|nr:ATP-binding protein [Chitinophaga sp. sic0106]MBV7531005.1 AAA family ATPase [Chitinophaga sp. sic0106]
MAALQVKTPAKVAPRPNCPFPQNVRALVISVWGANNFAGFSPVTHPMMTVKTTEFLNSKTSVMKPSQLSVYLQFAISNKFPVMIVGRPGIGKTDIVKDAANKAQADLIISHPVVSDPTDYKGLPFASGDGTADFLTFGELKRLVTAKKKTVFFLDDLGQASPLVQAACMQLLLAREINGQKISDHVTFIAATNRRQDRAAVTGILEPVKSRFTSIVGLDVDIDDWASWAASNSMPNELIAFMRFRPNFLSDFSPVADIENIPSPRTIAAVGKQQLAGIPQGLEIEAIKGAAGLTFAIEYTSFLMFCRDLPSLNDILEDPLKALVPQEVASAYAICGVIASIINKSNISTVLKYLDRLPIENSVCCLKDACLRNPAIASNREFIEWASKHASSLL